MNIRDKPAPKTYPTRICLGKYPIRAPSLNAPRAKNTRPAESILPVNIQDAFSEVRNTSPVRMALKANETMVVAMIARS
jgi:hypothetical protein